MRRTAGTILAALVALLGNPAGARAAAPGNLIMPFVYEPQRVGDGVVVVVVCGAVATPETGWVPVLTTVWCELNGATSPTVSVPGPVAATAVANVSTPPLILCIHSTAVFSPTIGPSQTITYDDCGEIPEA